MKREINIKLKEWGDHNNYFTECQALAAQIATTDRMVYALYGLTEEEIRTMEI